MKNNEIVPLVITALEEYREKHGDETGDINQILLRFNSGDFGVISLGWESGAAIQKIFRNND